VRIPKTTLLQSAGSALLLLVLNSLLAGQTHDVVLEISNVTGPDSPIEASGQTSFHEELSPDSCKTQTKIGARLVNVSKKTILAYEVSILAIPDCGGGMQHTVHADYFFRPELQFGPGAQEVADYDTPSWNVTPRKEGATPATPKATFEVIFVQFADGSKFGTSRWGTALPAVRKQTAEQLQVVLEAYRSSGEEGLALALAKARVYQDNPTFTNAILDDIKETLEAKGPEATAVEITAFLDAAQRRRSIM
jgi:hypothetical protein